VNIKGLILFSILMSFQVIAGNGGSCTAPDDTYNDYLKEMKDNDRYPLAPREWLHDCQAILKNFSSFSSKGNCIKCLESFGLDTRTGRFNAKEGSVQACIEVGCKRGQKYDIGGFFGKSYTVPINSRLITEQLQSGVQCGGCSEGKTLDVVTGLCKLDSCKNLKNSILDTNNQCIQCPSGSIANTNTNKCVTKIYPCSYENFDIYQPQAKNLALLGQTEVITSKKQWNDLCSVIQQSECPVGDIVRLDGRCKSPSSVNSADPCGGFESYDDFLTVLLQAPQFGEGFASIKNKSDWESQCMSSETANTNNNNSVTIYNDQDCMALNEGNFNVVTAGGLEKSFPAYRWEWIWPQGKERFAVCAHYSAEDIKYNSGIYKCQDLSGVEQRCNCEAQFNKGWIPVMNSSGQYTHCGCPQGEDSVSHVYLDGHEFIEPNDSNIRNSILEGYTKGQMVGGFHAYLECVKR